MSDLIRSATLTHYPEVAQSVGIDPRAMMRKVRLPLESLERPDLRIAVTSMRRLLEASAAASGVEEFGLLMAERGALANLGPVALVVREQATVGDALKALARFIHIHHEGMRLMIDRPGTSSRLPSACAAACRARRASQSEMALGSLHRIIRSLAGEDWRPLEAHLTHPPPRNRKYYRSFFGCPIIFNSEIDALVISARDLDRPIPSAHPLIANYLEKRVEAIDVRPRQWDERVSEVVRALLERRRLHGGARRRALRLHPAHHPPPSRRLRHQLFGDPRRGARRPRAAPDRGPQPAAGGGGRNARLLRAKRDGALVQGPLRPQRHRMA